MTIKELENIVVGRKQIAEIFGYKDEKYINELVKDFGAPKVSHGKYPLLAWIRWFNEYKKAIHEKEVRKLKEDKPQDDLARKNARLKEIEIMEKERELVPFEEMMIAHLSELQLIKTSLKGGVAKMSSMVTNEPKSNKIQKILNEEIDRIFEKVGSIKIRNIK